MAGDALDGFRADAERIFGDDLVSLTAYGSHAGDAPAPGREVSVLVVVRALRREALERFRAVVPTHARRGIAPPPVFTESFLRDSADVFPLEFLGMAERRRVLTGRDVLADLAVTGKNLRRQVEFELKGKLLSLRRMYLTAAGDRDLSRLVLDTAGPVAAVARGLLLLAEGTAPHGKEEILEGIERRFGLPLPRLREAVGARRAGRLAPARAAEMVFGYLDEVEGLCSLSDRLPVAGEG